MPVKEATFNKSDLIQSLTAAGLRAGDVLFVQLSLPQIGQMDGANSMVEACKQTLACLLEVIGSSGTLFVPAFTLSFERGEEFDPVHSAALAGDWGESAEFAELARRDPGAVRSGDPLYSVVGIGPMAEQLFTGLPNSSFGRDSIFERLLKSNARHCLIGVDLRHSVVFDFLEETVDVPWRYKKLFTGKALQSGVSHRQGWIASVTNNAIADESRAIRNRCASEAGDLLWRAQIGAGEILSVKMGDLCGVLTAKLTEEATHFSFKNHEVPTTNLQVQLPPAASMGETISALWRLPRDIVSDGYDVALRALATQVPMDVHEYPTGTECLTWLIPEKWACRNACLKTLDGRTLFSYQENPLHCVSYSLPFEGIVTREELFRHLHTHPRLDDAIPFIFKYYERDWGLCCSKNLKDSLKDEKYGVVIDSEFSFGSLKVGECIARGVSDQTFILCAHLCHPAMVNDDLSGVVVGMQVMQELLKRSRLRYTYRFLILPETIGSVAYLSNHLQLVPQMIGGLFLEMLGLENPHALQLSFNGNTEIDRCLSGVLTDSSPDAWIGAFRKVVGNDERQFNAPGIRVPMLSLSRVLRNGSNGWPYFPEYHSSHDNPELASNARLVESRDLVLRMIDAVETNEIPVNLFQGEVFCSRYGLHVDAYSDLKGNRALFDILFLVDGTRSVTEIARLCGSSVGAVRSVLEELRRQGLIAYGPL